MKRFMLVLWATALTLAPGVAFAADKLDTGNTAWILTSTALVLFMTLPGLSLFYGGLVRAKNVLSVLMQCFTIACAVSIVWLIVGYSLVFESGNAFIGGLGKAFFAGVGVDLSRAHTRDGLRHVPAHFANHHAPAIGAASPSGCGFRHCLFS